ncbi:MAG TPA: phosphatidate cytidylyltransferase [Flavipsychrobacter sp.]
MKKLQPFFILPLLLLLSSCELVGDIFEAGVWAGVLLVVVVVGLVIFVIGKLFGRK